MNDLRSPAGSALGPPLGIEYGKPLPFTFLRHHVLLLMPMSIPFIVAEKCKAGQRIVTSEYYGLLPSINDRSSCQRDRILTRLVDLGFDPGEIRTKLENGSYDAEFNGEQHIKSPQKSPLGKFF